MAVMIHQPWGGVGDNLQFSTLPELCFLNGEQCFLAKDNAYRNKNIEEFIWNTNPYITRQYSDTDSFRMASHVFLENRNIIECIEHASGFAITNHFPKIYYTPKILEEFKNKILVDTKSISLKCDFEKNIYDVVNSFKEDVIIIKNNHTLPKDYSVFEDYESMEIDNLFYYADIINSCKAIYTVTSGISVLAPAIKHKTNGSFEINVFTTKQYTPKYWHGMYWFNNVNYNTID